MKKSSLLQAAALLTALPFMGSLAMAQDNGSRSYLNMTGEAPSNVGAYAGQIKDSKGVQLGAISPSGEIMDGAGDVIGKINLKGKVSDTNGKTLGVVAPADRFGAYNLAKKASINN